MVDSNGNVTSSFGDGFGPSDEVSRLLFGAGRLLCVVEHQLIVVASRFYPGVRAYDEHGRLSWSHDLPDFRHVSHTETTPGRFEYRYPADSLWDESVSLFYLGRRMLAVQVGRRFGRSPNTPFRSIRTVFLSTADGLPLGFQTDLPLVKASGSGRLFSVDESGKLWILAYTVTEPEPVVPVR